MQALDYIGAKRREEGTEGEIGRINISKHRHILSCQYGWDSEDMVMKHKLKNSYVG